MAYATITTSPVSCLLDPLSCDAGPTLNWIWLNFLCLLETLPVGKIKCKCPLATYWVKVYVWAKYEVDRSQGNLHNLRRRATNKSTYIQGLVDIIKLTLGQHDCVCFEIISLVSTYIILYTLIMCVIWIMQRLQITLESRLCVIRFDDDALIKTICRRRLLDYVSITRCN